MTSEPQRPASVVNGRAFVRPHRDQLEHRSQVAVNSIAVPGGLVGFPFPLQTLQVGFEGISRKFNVGWLDGRAWLDVLRCVFRLSRITPKVQEIVARSDGVAFQAMRPPDATYRIASPPTSSSASTSAKTGSRSGKSPFRPRQAAPYA